MAALHAVLDFPKSVGALGLISTTAGGSGLTLPTAAYLEAATSRYESAGRVEATNDLELAVSAEFRTQHRVLYDALAKETPPSAVGPDELAQVFMNHDVSNRLGEVSVPTVVICGTGDQVHPLANSSFLSDHITDSRLVEIERAGHLLNVEAPELLIDELTRMAVLGQVPHSARLGDTRQRPPL